MSSIAELLGPGGSLAKALPGFEARDSQLEMAEQVEAALKSSQPLFVEAGTGTGKTLAYLVPALLSDKKILISTGTKNLQEQIFFKDVPLVEKVIGRKVKATYMKGRSNYLCIARYKQFAHDPLFDFIDDAEPYNKIIDWAVTTESGDRADVPGLPDNYAPWRELSATAEQCTGQKCKDFDQCFVTKMRQRAKESELVIVNHHLFFA